MADEIASLFQQLGGRATLEKVHKLFYDRIYGDPWISQYFAHVKRDHIESQQTEFMTTAMGGPNFYMGLNPIPAHQHIFISAELFELRSQFLAAALNEAGIPKNLAERWLKIDSSFKRALVKKDFNDCEKRFATDTILYFAPPEKKAA